MSGTQNTAAPLAPAAPVDPPTSAATSTVAASTAAPAATATAAATAASVLAPSAVLWDDLVSAALVGTDRRAGAPSDGDPALGLLAHAAAAVTRQAVGTRPAPFSGTLIEPMPADDRPLLTATATTRLRSLLDSYPKYLPEWLAAVHAAGYRVPAEFFPPLLDAARTSVPMRTDLALVLDAQGRWLAKTVRTWRFLLREARTDSTAADWDLGDDPDTRIAYVAGLYLKDPAAARDLIRRAWPHEAVHVKRPLLALMQRYPDPADIEFVEGLAADLSKTVRDDAKQLVTALRGRVKESKQPDFTTEAARLLDWRGVSRELHTFAMNRSGRLWPLDGARLLLDSIAAHAQRDTSRLGDGSGGSGAGGGSTAPATASSAMTGWLTDQLLVALGDNAPVALCGRVAEVIRDQTLQTLDGRVPTVDFTTLRILLEYRRDMLAELSQPTDTPTTEIPTTEIPTTEIPTTETPATETPTADTRRENR